ncbi:MAG: hypothetical protein Q9209_000394 [Squamulea sp. 1 TL-2023]
MGRPLKKKNGVVAGMPRSSGVRNSPIGSNHADGEGLDTSPDGDWFCQACASQPSPPPARGIFPLLRHSFHRKTPTAYKLPLSIRNHFENVATGDDGEYEELGAPPSKAKYVVHDSMVTLTNDLRRTRTGYDVPLDTLKLKDAKDNIIFCYKCNKSAMGHREMINCDFCTLNWHLDCVDPPLASAPKKFGKGTWKCPNHVDSDIAVPRSATGKTYKIRRPKDPRIIQTSLTRGIKNNGVIEIEDEISEEEDQPPGTVFRIPPRAIKLDFITKVKQLNLATARMGKHESASLKAERRQQQQRRRRATNGQGQQTALSAADMPNQDKVFRGRTSAEREAAVNLAEFAKSDAHSQLSGDRVEELVRTLYAEAPANVNGIPNGVHTSFVTDGDDTTSKMNGGSISAATSNTAAYAYNQRSSVGTPPVERQTLLAEEEEILRLEAILLRKKMLIQKMIAAAPTVTASV